jgi:glutathione S-transferase
MLTLALSLAATSASAHALVGPQAPRVLLARASAGYRLYRGGAARMSSTGALEFFTSDMCPYAQRVWIALEELQMPYNKTAIDLRDKPAWYTESINPLGKVPAVRLPSDGQVWVESLEINRQLVRTFDPDHTSGLLPADASAAAEVEQWHEHLDKRLSPAFFTALMDKSEAKEDAAKKRQELSDALRYYEEKLVGPFLCGEAFTLADIAAIPFFERLALAMPHYCGYDPLEPYPRVRGWMERVMARRSVAATLRPPDELIKLYGMFVSRDYKFGGLNRN